MFVLAVSIHLPSMKSGYFSVLCLAWLADMGALAAIGPLGRNVAAAMILYGCGFFLLVLIFRSFPAHLKTAHALGLVLALGLASRAAFLFFPPNTDIYRYIWEGAIQNHGFNPYLLPPADPALAFLAEGELGRYWQGINHKGLAAVYPPAAMLLFRLLAWISPTPLFFKAVFLLCDLGVMLILAALLRLRRLPAARLLFYAANPLVVVFISGEGHLDGLQVLFLCLGLLLLARRRSASAYLALGLAVLCKYLAAAAVPICWSRRAGWRALALAAPAALFVFYLPAGSALFASLEVFATRMHYNDFIPQVLEALFGRWSLVAAALFFFICLGWVWLIEDDRLRGVYLCVGCLLVMLPTLHPWYLAMIAPFLCFFPSNPWLYLQAAVLFTFPVFGREFHTGVFQEVPWLKLPEYLPFFALLAWGCVRRRPFSRVQGYAAAESISVIIPTLNEAERVGRLLADLRDRPRIAEIIVSDGGSGDDTVAIARACGARVIAGGRGRGVQVRAAARAATGDVVLVLHADARLDPGATQRIIAALAADRGAAGGCFGMQFRSSTCGRRVIAALNNLRAAAAGLSFGDQAQFVRAEALQQMGGFPDLMLMEDVELSLRMKALGGAVYLGPGVAVSGRRWQTGNYIGNIWTVVSLFMRYLLERRLGQEVARGERYYRKYYPTVA
jgi:rSAM/selenodomain-associated transferase 2